MKMYMGQHMFISQADMGQHTCMIISQVDKVKINMGSSLINAKTTDNVWFRVLLISTYLGFFIPYRYITHVFHI